MAVDVTFLGGLKHALHRITFVVGDALAQN